jgi:hypothetical protein
MSPTETDLMNYGIWAGTNALKHAMEKLAVDPDPVTMQDILDIAFAAEAIAPSKVPAHLLPPASTKP